jgi:hypothetical protein
MRDDRWKVYFGEDFRPMFFDLKNDPDELDDLGKAKIRFT